MRFLLHSLFLSGFLISGSWQQFSFRDRFPPPPPPPPPYSRHWAHGWSRPGYETQPCTHNFNTETCVMEVTCVGAPDGFENSAIGYNEECPPTFYLHNYNFVETHFKLKTFGDEIFEENSDVAQIITALDLSSNEYSEIPNLPAMERLKMLNVSSNSLTAAKLYSNNEFRSLLQIDYSHNIIANIEVDVEQYVFRKLKSLDLSHNYLVDIKDGIFDAFSDLEHLDLSFNFIDNLSVLTFEGMKNLVYLNLKHNRLSDLGLSLLRFNKLIELNLSDNLIQIITGADFEKLTKLEILDLKSNAISKIDENAFSKNNALHSLDLSSNQLTSILKQTFENLHALSKIDLSKNSITYLPKELFKDKQVAEFSVKENKLVGALEEGTFEGLQLVQSLDLSNQQLTSVEEFAFKGLDNLTTLLLNNNRLFNLSKHSFTTLNKLEMLDLSNNLLTSIEFNTDELRSLTSLLLHKNLLFEVKNTYFNGLDHLQFLDLSNNNISHLESSSFQSQKDLINIKITNNPLRGALEGNTFKGLNSLPLLDISGTLLTTIKNGSFNGMNQLKELNASHGKLSDLQYNMFLYTGQIEIIDFSHNELKDFKINTTELVNLVKLFLNNNLFKIISPSFLNGMPRLINLVVSHNQLESIDNKAFEDQNGIRYLDLSFNQGLRLNISQLVEAKSLVSLFLSGIQTNITFKTVEEMSVSRLEISHSNISNIAIIGLQSLKILEYLALNNNNITQVEPSAFSGVINLKELDLSYNKITAIQPGSFKDNTYLTSLNISHNMLTTVIYGIFRRLSNLETIDISYNEINDLKSERFYELGSLNMLIADHNNIRNIEADDFAGTRLVKLSIGDNPIPCHVLINLKKNGPQFVITAIRLDETSNDENVDGVTCNIDKNNFRAEHNDPKLSNEKVLFDIKEILTNISKNLLTGKSVDVTSKSDESGLYGLFGNISKKVDVNNSKNNMLLQDLLSANINTTNLLNRILKVLSETNTNRPIKISPVNLPVLPKENISADNFKTYLSKIESNLNDNIATSIAAAKQSLLDEINAKIANKMAANTPHIESVELAKHVAISSDESLGNSLIFLEICVGLILVILVIFIVYKFYNSGMFVPSRHSTSTRHLTDAMENSTL